jgi:hypothetical protein
MKILDSGLTMYGLNSTLTVCVCEIHVDSYDLMFIVFLLSL